MSNSTSPLVPRFTRRQLLGNAAVASLLLRAGWARGEEPAAHAPHAWAFFGSDKGQGIYRASWNAATGTLGAPELAAATDHPTFFVLHPQLPILYAANEAAGPAAGVSAFRFDRAAGTLTFLNHVSSRGDAPCYLAIDPAATFLFAANYTGGSLAALPLAPDGHLALGGDAFHPAEHGTGVVPDRQEAPHMHCVILSPDARFVLAADLGDDALWIFPAPFAGEAAGNSLLAAPVRIAARPGSGPRHLAFHPNGRWLYCIHELDCTVDLYDWSVSGIAPHLTLRPGSVVPTLPTETPLHGNTACELLVSADGRFLFTNTRGLESLTVFAIDATSGLLSAQQTTSTAGKITRLMAFDPSAHWLLACNQGSSTVTVFRNDTATGRLGDAPRVVPAQTPMCVAFI